MSAVLVSLIHLMDEFTYQKFLELRSWGHSQGHTSYRKQFPNLP